ncbi:MAG TPA: 1-(5-phosphoribosyl)-5-[(5-phosphoribosylamino)methylideneamino] imidazole-4-carboxamide isomerase [Wenzhouxiangella sp.]
MILIPALDLISGSVVRLAQGDYARQTQYQDRAIDRAMAYEKAGAQVLHLVDLDSAKVGGRANLDLIQEICQALSIPVQAGGGVRHERDVEARLKAGVSRVVVGSVLIKTPETFIQWLGDFGPDALVAGLDVKAQGQGDQKRFIPQAAGWTEPGEADLMALLDRLLPAGLVHVLCTDISRDGMMEGSANDLYRQLVARYPKLLIQASGGIGSSADLEATAKTGVAGCIVGRALLEGTVPLSDIARFNRPADHSSRTVC